MNPNVSCTGRGLRRAAGSEPGFFRRAELSDERGDVLGREVSEFFLLLPNRVHQSLKGFVGTYLALVNVFELLEKLLPVNTPSSRRAGLSPAKLSRKDLPMFQTLQPRSVEVLVTTQEKLKGKQTGGETLKR